MKKLYLLLTLVCMVTSNSYAQSTDDETYEQATNYYYAKEYNKAIVVLNELATRNHAKAINLLGMCYEFGNGVPKNREKAKELYVRAAGLGLPRACKNMCYVLKEEQKPYMDNWDYDKVSDYNDKIYYWNKKALEAYLPHANDDDADAQYEVALCYDMVLCNDAIQEEYKIGDDDEKQREIWLRKAAKQNHLDAQYVLANVIDGDDKEFWMKKAAENGHVRAMTIWGIMELCHDNYQDAIVWMEKAISKGFTSEIPRVYIDELKATPSDIIILCDFLLKNSQYKLSHRQRGGEWGSDGKPHYYMSKTNECPVIVLNDIITVVCDMNGRSGVLQLNKKGEIVNNNMIPFKYDVVFMSTDLDVMGWGHEIKDIEFVVYENVKEQLGVHLNSRGNKLGLRE